MPKKAAPKKKISKKAKTTKKKTTILPKNANVEKVLVENFISLQKVMTNLAVKFDNLGAQISKLLELFEISAKTLAKKDIKLDAKPIEDKKVAEKLDELLGQNKIIAKGLTLLHETPEMPLIPPRIPLRQRPMPPIQPPMSRPLPSAQPKMSQPLPPTQPKMEPQSPPLKQGAGEYQKSMKMKSPEPAPKKSLRIKKKNETVF